jgi:hypothetical protein
VSLKFKATSLGLMAQGDLIMGFVTVNEAQNLQEKFSHKSMKSLMEYLATQNCETQALAVDGTDTDIASTGTKSVTINGQPMRLASETGLSISACTAGTETAWVTATSYSVGNVRKNGSEDTRYMCILAHTSRDNSDSDYICNEPGESDNWARFWEQRDNKAVNGSGTVITKAYEQWFLVTAIEDGTLQVWEAGDEATKTAGAECKVPQYDPKTYVPVGFLHIAADDSAAFTLGTTSHAAASAVTTYLDTTGPIFPHPDNWDKN